MEATYEVRTAPTGVAEQIIEAAKAGGADLIVMSSQGRLGVVRLVLGSVAERVMRTATNPVLVVSEVTEERLPEPIAEALDLKGEVVAGKFLLDQGAEVFLTEYLVSQRGDAVAAVPYNKIKEARYRPAMPLPKVVVGIGFIVAGTLFGFATPLAIILSLLLMAIGVAYILIALLCQRASIDFAIEGKNIPPLIKFLIFPLPYFIRTKKKRYQLIGRPSEVARLFALLGQKLELSQAGR